MASLDQQNKQGLRNGASGLVSQIPGNEGPYGVSNAPAKPGLLESVGKQLRYGAFPNTMAAGERGMQQAREEFAAGDYGKAVGTVGRTALQQVKGLVTDTFVEPYVKLGQPAQRAVAGRIIQNVADTVGAEIPANVQKALSAPTPSEKTAAQPSPLQPPGAGRSTVLNTTTATPPGSPSASAFDRTNDVRTAINTGRIPDSISDGRIWNSGNMYVGKDVKFGAPITDARTGMNREGRGNFNVIDNSAGRAYNESILREAAERRAAQAGQAMPQESVQDRVLRTVNAIKAAGGKISAPTLRQIINSEADIINNRLTNETSRRNQDMTNESNRARLAFDQNKALLEGYYKDREFDLNLTKEQRAAREAGEKQVIDRVTGMLPLTGDPEKDGPMKATALQRLNMMLGQETARLRQALQQNPKDAATAKQLQRLESQGIAAFAGNEESLLRYVLGSQLVDISRQADGLDILGRGNASPSNEPVKSLRWKPSILPWHDGYYVTDRKLPDGSNEEIPAADVPFDARVLLREQ